MVASMPTRLPGPPNGKIPLSGRAQSGRSQAVRDGDREQVRVRSGTPTVGSVPGPPNPWLWGRRPRQLLTPRRLNGELPPTPPPPASSTGSSIRSRVATRPASASGCKRASRGGRLGTSDARRMDGRGGGAPEQSVAFPRPVSARAGRFAFSFAPVRLRGRRRRPEAGGHGRGGHHGSQQAAQR